MEGISRRTPPEAEAPPQSLREMRPQIGNTGFPPLQVRLSTQSQRVLIPHLAWKQYRVPSRDSRTSSMKNVNRGQYGLENREPSQKFQGLIPNGGEGAPFITKIEISLHPGK